MCASDWDRLNAEFASASTCVGGFIISIRSSTYIRRLIFHCRSRVVGMQVASLGEDGGQSGEQIVFLHRDVRERALSEDENGRDELMSFLEISSCSQSW